MRGICLVLVLLGVPAIAAAQDHRTAQHRGGAAHDQRTAQHRDGSLPSLGLPLPSIGLPLPSIGLPLPPRLEEVMRQRGEDPYGDNRRGNERRSGEWRDGGQWTDGRQSRGSFNPYGNQRGGPAYVYVTPPYPYGYPYYGPYYGTPSTQVITQTTTVPGVITVVPEPLTGRLLLEVEPADILQVFVDGDYVGTPADLGGALDLPPGSRRIEFRAPGHKTLTIDAQIVSQRSIVYRATLDRIGPPRMVPPAAAVETPAPAPAPAPTGSRTMYLIPGCYMGNVPPQDLKLPASCDLSRMTTIKP